MTAVLATAVMAVALFALTAWALTLARNVRARSRYDFTERRSWATRFLSSASMETHEGSDFCFSLT